LTLIAFEIFFPVRIKKKTKKNRGVQYWSWRADGPPVKMQPALSY